MSPRRVVPEDAPELDLEDDDEGGEVLGPSPAAGARELWLDASASDAGARLDAWLASRLPELSRSRLRQLIDDGHVEVGGRSVKPSLRVDAGQRVRVLVPPPSPIEAEPEDIPLVVVYEDAEVIVVDKPAGLVVHPAAGVAHGTLVNAVLFRCRDLRGIGGDLRPGIVHRIDKGTTGLLVVAKSDLAHGHLAAAFKAHTIHRRYLALVHGAPEPPRGTIDTLYGRDPRHRTRFSSKVREGRRAVTHYEVLERFTGCSLLRLRLETGRTHQIRVHLAERGHPVIGDPTYGRPLQGSAIPSELLRAVKALDHQLLHAAELGFTHPATGAAISFSAPLPDDFARILELARRG